MALIDPAVTPSATSVSPVPPPQGRRPRHPLTGVLTALTIVLALLLITVVALGALWMVRTAPAPVLPTRQVDVTVMVHDTIAQITVRSPTGASTRTLDGVEDENGVGAKWTVDVPSGAGVSVEVTPTAGGITDRQLEPATTCTIKGTDGGAPNVANRGEGDNAGVACSWTNA